MAKRKTDKSPVATTATTATPAVDEGAPTAKKLKPTADEEIITSLAKSFADDEGRFIFEMYWRARTLLDDSGLSHTAIAFEMTQSAFSAFEGGLSHRDIAEGYPVETWREDTIEIPRAWLRVLVEGWEKHKSGNVGSTLGEAFGIEGGGQGKQPVRGRIRKLNLGIRLSNRAFSEYLAKSAEGGQCSLEEVFFKVADQENVSADTVKRAYRKHRKATLSRAEYLQMLR